MYSRNGEQVGCIFAGSQGPIDDFCDIFCDVFNVKLIDEILVGDANIFY